MLPVQSYPPQTTFEAVSHPASASHTSLLSDLTSKYRLYVRYLSLPQIRKKDLPDRERHHNSVLSSFLELLVDPVEHLRQFAHGRYDITTLSFLSLSQVFDSELAIAAFVPLAFRLLNVSFRMPPSTNSIIVACRGNFISRSLNCGMILLNVS